jgi:hypothetical protein
MTERHMPFCRSGLRRLPLRIYEIIFYAPLLKYGLEQSKTPRSHVIILYMQPKV